MPGIHSGHRARVRERAEAEGLDGFQAHELMELLLFYCVPRRDVNEQAHALIGTSGSVKGALEAPCDCGERTSRVLRDLGSLITAYQNLRVGDRPLLNNYLNAFAFLESRFGGCKEERAVWLVSADMDGRVISVSEFSAQPEWARPDALLAAIRIIMLEHASSVMLVKQEDFTEYDTENMRRFSQTLSGMGVMLLDMISLGKKRSMYCEGAFARPDWLALSGTEVHTDPDPIKIETGGNR